MHQKRNDEDIFHNQNQSQVQQRSKRSAGTAKGVKRFVYLLVNQLLNPHSFFPSCCHISLCVISLLLHFQSPRSFLFVFSG